MDGGAPAAASGRNPQLLRLSALLELEQRARSLGAAELGYLMVNDTVGVVAYQQAAFWRAGKVAVVSGVAAIEQGGPYHRWLARVLAAAAAAPRRMDVHEVDAATLGVAPAEWEEWFPPQAVWCPLVDRRGHLLGGLLFGRADPWRDAELHLLGLLAGSYAQCLAMDELPTRRSWRGGSSRRVLWATGIVAALAVSLMPIRASVLAPAEVVAAAPFPIRAPFDGVVASVAVTPNARVTRGELLVSFDTTERQAKTDVAEKALEIARAEYVEASQRALTDPRAKGRFAILQAKVAQAEAELAYDRATLARAAVKAPIDGVAVFDDAQQWSGHPAVLGERIMVIAPAHSADLDIRVPIAQVVTFAPDAEVLFFSNVDPDHPSRGRLTYAGYDSTPGPDGVMAYIFRAHLAALSGGDADGLRLGLKGTAKIFGPRRPFLLWALRRPLAVVRQWLSL
jgi:hypothetical protein